MDAVLFLKEKHRMCKSYGFSRCRRCELNENKNGKQISCGGFVYQYPEEAVAIVEEWSNENPLKTKKDKFFEMFPNAPKVGGGYPLGHPCDIGWCGGITCGSCERRHTKIYECWDLPYKGDD